MRNIKTSELKQIQLNILKQVHNFCEENKIPYFLAYGTLIGAVRHKGYIPWDDDIDIVMLREDYMRFIELFNSERYKVYSPENNAACSMTFAKIYDNRTLLKEKSDLPVAIELGINIDLFPLEKYPDKEHAIEVSNRIQKYLKLYFVKNISVSSDRAFYKNLILRVGKVVLRRVTFKKLVMKICTEAQKYNKAKNCTYVGQTVFPVYGNRGIVPKEIFSEIVQLEFEGEKFNAPIGYDAYLKAYYGDYMHLPAIEKQVTHHDFKAWWK